MSETLAPPKSGQHEREVSANFLRGEAAQLLGALVVKLLTDEHFQKAAAEMMANYSATKESQKTEKTNRQMWNDLLEGFQGSTLPPLDVENPYPRNLRTPDMLYSASGAFLPKDYWSDGSTRYTYDEHGRTEHEYGTQWDGTYGWGPNGKPKSGGETGTHFNEGADDSKAKSSTNQTPSGPRMPFNVHPASMKPNETQVAAASRANDLLREGLQKQGWEGGVPTQDQLKKATRETLRNLHPDRNENVSDIDQEAAKLISGQMNEIKQELFPQEPEGSQDDNMAQAA